MAWNTIAASDVLVEFTPAEKAMLNAVQGADTQLAAVLTNVVALVRGSIQAGGYALDSAGKIPDQLRLDAIALARWRWLISLPQVKNLQTDARKAAAERAEKRFDDVSKQKLNVEPPASADTPSGNWNSEPKILGRTHPVPKPSSQFQGTTDSYANPDGPQDT